jgi:threonylcarbamoyladenosine tRNA methylthiotransferase MtaB
MPVSTPVLFPDAMPRVALHTLGCKLNFAETSAIGGQFMARGYDVVEFGDPADVVVINTCSVTERADRECRQLIRRALRRDPGAVVVVTGCYAQLAPEKVASIEGVDVVLGSREKFSVFDTVGMLEKKSTPRVFVREIAGTTDFGPAMSGQAGDRTRAFLKVQDGCDYSCSYCTIPLARGASRSQPTGATVLQAESLIRAGFKEIVLTGVNVGDYGRKEGSSLLELLSALAPLQGLYRLRVSSIEPNLLTTELLEFVAQSPVLCKHFHIPLQSGTDSVLRRMRRRYTTDEYESVIRRVKDTLPGCGIGADVITGFPGETDDEFLSTYHFLNDLPVSYLHVFTYSERPNTPAAEAGTSVEPRIRQQRSEMLRILGEKKRTAFLRKLVGTTATILTEGIAEDGFRSGFTDSYARVAVPAPGVGENELVRVSLASVRDGRLEGRPVPPREEAA